MRAISSGPFLRVFMKKPAQDVNKHDKDLLLNYLKVTKKHYEYNSLVLTDKRGNIILTTDRNRKTLDEHSQILFKEILQRQEPVFGDFCQCPYAGTIIEMGAPIRDADNESIITGALLIRISPYIYLYPLIQNWPTASDTSETLLVRRDGDDVLFLNELRHQKGTALTLRFPISSANLPAAAAVRGIAGEFRGRDYRGEEVFSVINKVPDSPWYLITKTDAQEIFTLFHKLAYMLVVLVIILITLLAAGIGYFWRQRQYEFYRNQYETEAERRAAQENIKTLAARQEALLSAIPDIIMEVDTNKIYTWANEPGKEFFGNDVVGKEAVFYFEGEQDTYVKTEPLFRGNEEVVYLESWQRRKDGEKRLLAWWCRVLKDEQGNVTGALSSARDITEQKLTEQEIIKLNEELELRVARRTAELTAKTAELQRVNKVFVDRELRMRELKMRIEELEKNKG